MRVGNLAVFAVPAAVMAYVAYTAARIIISAGDAIVAAMAALP